MNREAIYERAKAIKEAVEKIETPDVEDKAIVKNCNTLVQESKAVEKDLKDLQEIPWDEDNNCASKTETLSALNQIIALLKPEWGTGVSDV